MKWLVQRFLEHGFIATARLVDNGIGRWRKRKGRATVRLRNGQIREAEVHWYEASGIGKREFKIKCLFD